MTERQDWPGAGNVETTPILSQFTNANTYRYTLEEADGHKDGCGVKFVEMTTIGIHGEP